MTPIYTLLVDGAAQHQKLARCFNREELKCLQLPKSILSDVKGIFDWHSSETRSGVQHCHNPCTASERTHDLGKQRTQGVISSVIAQGRQAFGNVTQFGDFLIMKFAGKACRNIQNESPVVTLSL